MRIPLEIVAIDPNGTHLLLDVAINGKSLKLVLDTGASRSVFDLEYLKEIEPDLEIHEEEATSAGVGAINIISYTAVVENFDIGSHSLKNVELAVMDLAAVLQSYEKIGAAKIHGVLGGDILLKGKAIINYANQELYLDENALRVE